MFGFWWSDTRRLEPRFFLVAGNPESDSTLPYLVRLSRGESFVLKAGDDRLRTVKVHCHRAEAWPDPVEVLQEVPVRSCARRGVAVDLVGRHQARYPAVPPVFCGTRPLAGEGTFRFLGAALALDGPAQDAVPQEPETD